MINFAFVDANGVPTSGGRAFDLPEGSVELSAPYLAIDLPKLIFLEKEWFERPLLPEIEETPNGFSIIGLDRPVTVTITDLDTGSAEVLPQDTAEVFADLPENGIYEIKVSAKLPWLPSEKVITRGVGSAAANLAQLQNIRNSAVGRINESVGKFRSAFSTDINGQSAIYLEKRVEAAAYLANAEPPESLNDYPFLKAELGVTASNAQELSQIWMNMSAIFSIVGAATEKARMVAINAALIATTEEELQQIEMELRRNLRFIFSG